MRASPRSTTGISPFGRSSVGARKREPARDRGQRGWPWLKFAGVLFAAIELLGIALANSLRRSATLCR